MNPIPDFAPGPIDQNVGQRYFDRGARVSVERNRLFVLALLLALALFANALLLWRLFPLTRVDAVVVREGAGGRLESTGERLGAWQPSQANLSYFLNQWADNVFDINPPTLERTTKDAGDMVTGVAKAQLTQLRQAENPWLLLKDHPGLIREYRFLSINFVEEHVALLRCETITHQGNREQSTIWLLRITFTIDPPHRVEDVIKNPAGLFITNFNVSKEAA